MKKSIFLIAIFFSTSFCSITSAQNEICDSCKRVSISICPTEMISGFETMYFDYKFSGHFSLGIGAGHIFPFVDGIIAADKPTWAAYNGTILRAYSKYFFRGDGGLYIGLMATYKNLYYSWHSFSYKCSSTGDEGMYDFVRSENTSLFGATILFGSQPKSSNRMTVDFFCGIGISIRSRDYTTHSTDYFGPYCGPASVPPLGNFTESKIIPSFPCGIKLVFDIYEKQ